MKKFSLENKPSFKEWQSFDKKLRALRTQIFELYKEKRGSIVPYTDRVYPVAQEIMKNLPDHQSYVAYAVLVMGSSDFEKQPFLDLPEPYSVENFFKELIQELEAE